VAWSDAYDEIVRALRALLHSNVNVDLAAELAVSAPAVLAVTSTYGMPIPFSLARTLRLPALAIYRQRTRGVELTQRHLERQTDFRIDFVMDQTPAHQLEEQWDLLHRVAESVLKSLCTDVLAADITVDGVAYSADDTPLRDAGVIEFDPDNWQVTYQFVSAQGAGAVYPFFAATAPMLHDPRVPNLSSPSTVTPLTMSADIDLHEGTEDVNPYEDLAEVQEPDDL